MIPLDQFLLPMVLASDAVMNDGDLIGDPTEGALVVLAAKGGARRRLDPRRPTRAIAELPFDAEYKLMATFHRMTDETGGEVVRCFVKGAPDQLLARAADRLTPTPAPVPVDDAFARALPRREPRLGEQGLRVLATARKDFDPADVRPDGDLLAADATG